MFFCRFMIAWQVGGADPNAYFTTWVFTYELATCSKTSLYWQLRFRELCTSYVWSAPGRFPVAGYFSTISSRHHWKQHGAMPATATDVTIAWSVRLYVCDSCTVLWAVGRTVMSFGRYTCVIPRLHDKAGSTSWLVECSSSQFDERSTSARRALDEQLRECLQYYTIQMTR